MQVVGLKFTVAYVSLHLDLDYVMFGCISWIYHRFPAILKVDDTPAMDPSMSWTFLFRHKISRRRKNIEPSNVAV